LLLGSAVAKAEPDDPPKLSVLAFTARQGLLSPPETAELADDLASRRTGWMPPPRLGETLAELLTARLTADDARVIDRSWLPEAKSAVFSRLPLVGGSRSSVTGIQDRLLDDAVQVAMEVAAAEMVAVAVSGGTI
jgi:hypothetical protein